MVCRTRQGPPLQSDPGFAARHKAVAAAPYTQEAPAREYPKMDPLPVRLRPFLESDLALFDRFATEPELSEPFEWVGFTSPLRYRQRWEEDRLLGSSPYC